MENLEIYRKLKVMAEKYEVNRHLYVANIIKGLFDPNIYNFLCEIGAGKMELANILINYYRYIDAYEAYNPSMQIINGNINTYGVFNSWVDVSSYDLLLSICPYCFSYDEFDDYDSEKETKKLVSTILNFSADNNISSFVVLSTTPSSEEIVEEIKDDRKFKDFDLDSITLFYEEFGQNKVSNNRVLIYRAQ